MPFLRFARDKRGVESFSLVHATTNRRGKVRPRVLYFFRTPPDIKVGREPFDPDLRRALEKQYPDITFDWRAIVETPIPSADADKWRERRRAERAAKHAAAAEASAEAAEAAASDDDAEDGAAAADEDVAAPDAAEPSSEATVSSAAPPATAAPPAPRVGTDPNRKRRRRRRGGDRPSTGFGTGRSTGLEAGGGNAPSSGTPAPSTPLSGGEPSGD